MKLKAWMNKLTHIVGYQLVRQGTLERLVKESEDHMNHFVSYANTLGWLTQLHEINWAVCKGVAREKMMALVFRMLGHDVFAYENNTMRTDRAHACDSQDLDIEEYCPYFFQDRDLILTLVTELQLEKSMQLFNRLEAAGRYNEGPHMCVLGRETSLDIKVFYAYRHLAMRVYHRGEGHLIPSIGQRLFEVQERLRARLPAPSSALKKFLDTLEIELADVRLFLPEWTALIGHQGHLDVHLMMRDMGWWKGTPLILARHGQLANYTFLSLFKKRCPVLIAGHNISADLWLELVSLTPFLSSNLQLFTFENDSNRTVYWNDAGAEAVQEWERQGRGFPMRDAYDAHPSFEATDSIFKRTCKEWGMSPSDWYVCLHLRDSQTRNGTAFTGEAIRDTSVENYIEAIRYITAQGGWVIRMGGPKAPKLPAMPRVIDYAHSVSKSEEMDLHLVRKARFFIGTTSGFAYVASSFGIPIALVNAIAGIGWLLFQNTRITPKKIYHKTGRLLSQYEMTTEQWRWKYPTHETAERAGLTVQENSPDEILETVKEVFALTSGSAISPQSPLWDSWQKTLLLPTFYGGALPSHYFLEKHAESFLAHTVEA